MILKSDCDKKVENIHLLSSKNKQLLENEIAYLKEQHSSLTLMFNDSLSFIERIEKELSIFKESMPKQM